MPIAPVKAKVLIIEDQPETADTMALLLRRVGFEVATAASGLEAINLARREEFDLITLDIDLPGMNGFEVCAYLKQDARFYRTPIIFVSGRLGETDRRRGLEAGATDFIVKPFDPFTFVSRIISCVKPIKN